MTTQYSFGDDVALLEQYCWYSKNAGGTSHLVGTRPPNGFGLHDMHGNLHEWCQDIHAQKSYEMTSSEDPNGPVSGSHHVLRGGGWNFSAFICRTAFRSGNSPSQRNVNYGFRVVRVLDVNVAEP